MRIQLVTPKNPPSFWTFDSVLGLLGVDCIFPNLSMPTVAALTPPGHDLVLSDENLDPVPFDLDVDLVGITGYPIHRDRIAHLAAEFRSRGRRVVLGGPFATLFPDEAAAMADVVIVGEAEETWPTFLAELARGHHRPRYVAPELPALTDAPMPRFDLVEVGRYHAMAIQFSRGCPFHCEFCDITTMYGRTPRTKSVANVLAEIQACHDAGVRQVFIVDDNFAGNKRRAKEMLRAMARWGTVHGYPIEFNTELSLDVAQDAELLALLRDANVTTVFVGIESPNVAALAETGKTQNTRVDLLEGVRRFHQHGIQVQAGMIVGFDADGPDIFDRQAEFAQQASIPIVMVGMLQAIEGTRLYERILAEGRLIDTTSGDQFVRSNIVPAQMTSAELHDGYRRLLHRLYDWRAYEDRVVAFLRRRGRHAPSSSTFSRRDLRAAPGVIGLFFGRHGRHRAWFCWRTLTRVAIHRPSAIVEALSFIVMHKAMHDYTAAISPRLVAPELDDAPRRPGVRVEIVRSALVESASSSLAGVS